MANRMVVERLRILPERAFFPEWKGKCPVWAVPSFSGTRTIRKEMS